MTIQQLETERLVLEPLSVEHAAALAPFLNDPALYEYLDDDPPGSIAALEVRYRRWSAGVSPDGSELWLNWAARLRGTDQFVGCFQATVHSSATADIAWIVFVEHQRRGFAREASNAVIAHLIAAYHVTCIGASMDARNLASIRLARSLGLVQAESKSADLRFVRSASDHPAIGTAT